MLKNDCQILRVGQVYLAKSHQPTNNSDIPKSAPIILPIKGNSLGAPSGVLMNHLSPALFFSHYCWLVPWSSSTFAEVTSKGIFHRNSP